MFNISEIREQFPILSREIYEDTPLVYLDNGATTLKPKVVVEQITDHYLMGASNIHRGVHFLSQQATELFENTRDLVKELINAKNREEVIFTRGTTTSINLLAYSFGSLLKEGDEIIISQMEHHSNIVPWQLLAERKNCKIKVIPMDQNGDLMIEQLPSLITEKTALISVVYISNALGTVNDIKKIIEIAHKNGVPVVIDAAQAIAHIKIDVQKLDCDFLVFSSHKMFGPTGVGVLYGKKSWLEKLPPFEGGGDMIESVTFEKTTYNTLPHYFEAGTPDIAGVIGLGAAIKYINNIGLENIYNYEQKLLNYATEKLKKIDKVKIIGTPKNKASIISFVIKNIHPHDIGTLLDEKGVAIRAGHHCAQPVMQFFKIPATARASLCFYNNKSDIDKLVEAIKYVLEVFDE